MMKIFNIIALALCMFAVVQAVTWQDAPRIGVNCGKLHGLNITVVKDVAEGKYPKPSKIIIQHIICCFTDVTWLTETGDWDTDNMKTIMHGVVPEVEVKRIVEECAVKKDTV